MDATPTTTCPGCGSELERLGGTRTKHGAGAVVEIVHFECPACGKRWVHHSTKGWSETDRELND